jgi:hypothetical protein
MPCTARSRATRHGHTVLSVTADVGLLVTGIATAGAIEEMAP